MKDLDAWRRAARYFSWGGDSIAYWTAGENDETRPWLLLIHGYPTSSWDWTGVWPALAARFRLAALDMLGFGLSDKPRGRRYSILDQADLQEALLERLGAGEAHILAHDYGDTVAQELLARGGEGTLSFSLRSICFLNGGLFPEQHRARPLQKLGLTPLGPVLGLMMTRGRLKRAFDAIFGPETKPAAAEIDAHWALICEKGGRRVLHRLLHYIPERIAWRERWVGALEESRVPLRLIVGGADPVSGRHLHHYYCEKIPNADTVLFDDLGHYPHTEAPARVAEAFLAFHKTIGTVAA